jgi:uroporphyrinogen decarboxylase
MTSRERWLAVARREKPDRIPMDFWGTDEVRARLRRHLAVSTDDEVWARLHIDRPVVLDPPYVGPPLAADTDMWGVRYRDMPHSTGSYREVAWSPLAAYDSVDELEARYRWPSPDWFDYRALAAQVEGAEERPVEYSLMNVYALYTRMRGMEQAFVDYAVHHEMVLHFMDRTVAFHRAKATRVLESLPRRVDFAWISNDMGSQEDLLFSPETMRKLFLPGIRAMAALGREAGALVVLHSDGAIRKAIPDLIDAGIGMLNPVQWRCRGMGREGLVRDFGRSLLFHGAVDNQETLARGSPADVRREVRENIDIFGPGYVLAPCHNLQPVSPMENIVALYDEGFSYGRL